MSFRPWSRHMTQLPQPCRKRENYDDWLLFLVSNAPSGGQFIFGMAFSDYGKNSTHREYIFSSKLFCEVTLLAPALLSIVLKMWKVTAYNTGVRHKAKLV